MPFAVGQLLAAPRSAATVARFGYRPVMTTVWLMLVACADRADRHRNRYPIWMLLGVFFLFGLGMGNVIAPASTVMQNVLPLARAGAGSAVQNTVRQVGGALGVAIVGTVLATQYASNLASSARRSEAVTEGCPTEQLQAPQESIVATEAGACGGGSGCAARDRRASSAAFSDFLAASHLAVGISAGIVILAALIVGFGLPHITPPHAQGAHRAQDTETSINA